jgi:hypothetical protein
MPFAYHQITGIIIQCTLSFRNTLAYGDIAAAAFATKGGGKMFSEK